MTEAKSFKMKEYFTQTTYHDKIEVSDMSGLTFAAEERSQRSRSRSGNRASPIRLNDTYRSTLVLGDESNDFARYNSCISNKVVDQQLVHRTNYFYHTRSGLRDEFSAERGHDYRKLSSTPTNREISSEQQKEITISNKKDFHEVRERCGL